MDPNSSHQLWSKWIVTIRANSRFAPKFEHVQENTGRFLRKGFGTAGQWKLEQFRHNVWVVTLLVDAQRHPDSRETFEYYKSAIVCFFQNGFGSQASVHVKARLMAGARLDGLPADQMLIMPSFRELVASEMAKERVH